MRLRLPTRARKVLRCGALTLSVGVAALWAYVALMPKPHLLEDVPFSRAFYDRNGELLRLTLAQDGRYRLFTPLDQISPDLIEATLTQEDRYFFRHPGVNPVSLLRGAATTYVKRSRPVGGSTITMQVARLHDQLDTRSLPGKARQILRALQLEYHYSKRDILEAYLNLAPYGGNIHGAGTASRIYFHLAADRLALPHSIALAVIPQNPLRRSPQPTDHPDWREARLRLFSAMPDSKKIYAREMQMPLSAYGRADLPFMAPHFVNGLEAAPGNIRTTLDLELQRIIERSITAWAGRNRSRDLDNAAAMLVDLRSLEVLALAGSADFNDTLIGGENDGTAARRSPGSTLKPFVYALALEQGLIHPESLLSDAPAYFAEYRPGNFDRRFMGRIPAREALYLSRNIPAIELAAHLKNPDLYEFLQNTGAGLPRDKSHYGLSMVVGGAETTMRTLVRLYAMLGNGGQLGDLKMLADASPLPPARLLSPEAALLTLTMLERPDPDTLPFARDSGLPVYWKTGTSSAFRDAWTIGIFGPYVLAVWTGHFDGRPSPALIGTEAAAPLFFDLVEAISRERPVSDLIHPQMKHLNLAKVDVCPQSGLMEVCGQSRAGWFIPGKSPFSAATLPERPVDILSPRSGLTYVRSRSAAEKLRIPLEARSPDKSSPLYWFANQKLIAVTTGDAPVFWEPEAGRYSLSFVDAGGRSASRPIVVVDAD